MVAALLKELFSAERRRTVVMLLALSALGVAQALFLALVKSFVRAMFADGAGDVAVATLLPAQVLAWFPALQGKLLPAAQLAVAVPLAIAAAGLAKAFATYVYQLSLQGLALAFAKLVRDRIFAALLASPYAAIRARPAGGWMSVIMNDVMFLQQRFSDFMVGLVKDGIMVLACFAVLFWVHPPSALVLLAASPFIAFGMGRTGTRIARYAEQFQRELGRLASAVLDLRARFAFIRAQGGEERELERFKALSTAYYRMIRKSIMVRSAFAPVLELVGFVLFAAAIWAIGEGGWGAGFSADDLMVFCVALGLLLKPLKEMGEQIGRLEETRGALKSALNLLSAPPPLRGSAFIRDELRRDVEGATNAEARKGGGTEGFVIRQLEAGAGDLVTFRASALRVSPGRAVAIIGPSGAGKSTLLKTLAGLLPPKIWDADLPWPDLAASTSMVSQDPFLFDDTLEANLLYGLEGDAKPSPSAIEKALADANVLAEARAFEAGLQTRIRTVGANVSGGQLQRLTVARSLLRKKPIWLLDEATSAMDSANERAIIARLIAACHAEKAVLLAVTHRLQGLEAYDEVWFVEGGRLALRGPHRELLKDARYRDYCAAGGEA